MPPIVCRELQQRFPVTFNTPTKARVPAALLDGMLAYYLTQPFDMINMYMQWDVAHTRFGSLWETAVVLWGMTFWYGRLVCMVFMIDVL